jgi:DNA-directed RNA polymerase specialized sigma24 family protein
VNEPSDPGAPGSDAELLNAIRSGDPGAYDVLRGRHEAAAGRLAGLLGTGAAADEIVSLAFAQVLDAISRGGGPTDAFRPYLLTAVRRAALAGEASAAAPVPTDAHQLPDPGQPLIDPSVAQAAASPVVAAFESLPERWRAVLWHTQVERTAPAEVGALLGLTAADVAVLADRARDGLAQAVAHSQQAPGPADTGSDLRRAVAPVVLGAAADAYLATVPGSPESPVPAEADRAERPALLTGPAGTSGAAAGWLARQARGASRHRTVTLGAAALLIIAAAGGYALSLNAHGGADGAAGRDVAAGAPLPAGLSASAGSSATAATPAPSPSAASPIESPPAPASPAGPGSSGASNSPGPAAAPPVAAAPPRSAASTTAPPATAPPGAAPPTAAPPTAPPGTAPPGAAPPTSAPPTAAPGPTAPRPGQVPDARVTTAVSVFGPVGFSRVGTVAFGVANAGPAATGDLAATVSLPAGTALASSTGAFGWTCSAAGHGAACVHGPIGAAARTGSILTVQITGSAACGQLVSVTVTGGESAASAQSGTIQCSQPLSFDAIAGLIGRGGASVGGFAPMSPAPVASPVAGQARNVPGMGSRDRDGRGPSDKTPGRGEHRGRQYSAGQHVGRGDRSPLSSSRGPRAWWSPGQPPATERAGFPWTGSPWTGSPWPDRSGPGAGRPGGTWPGSPRPGHGPTWP